MVFQNKGGAKARQTPKKNKVERNDDLDYESDSDQIITKTPKTPDAKTPKRKQPQSDKKVSFQISGKNTPAKTPKNENFLVGKKPTPAKMSLKEFKGVKAPKNGKQKRQSFDQDDDDDDEEDDNDDEEEEEDDDSEMDDDDEDGDDDDDDDEDDDDDDDDDEEEEDDSLNRKLPAKQSKDIKTSPLGKNKTPVKNAEQSPNKGADKKTSKTSQDLEISTSPKKNNLEEFKKALVLPSETRYGSEKRKLFMGNLPTDITKDELKKLSRDIVEVIIKRPKFKAAKTVFAYLTFESEQKADENYNSLQKKKLRNVPVVVDYLGEKSKNIKIAKNAANRQILLHRLYVPTLPINSTIVQVAGFFPKAFQITLITHSSSHKSAFINYKDDKSAAADLEACQSAELDGKPLAVIRAVHRQKESMEEGNKKNFKRYQDTENNQNAKRIKLQEIESDNDD